MPLMKRILTSCAAPALAATVAMPTAQAASDSSKSVTLRGEVDGFSTVDIGADERGLIRIRLENGRSAIVDVGSSRDVRQLAIEQGDHIRIEGSKQRLNGQAVVNARRLQVKQQPGDDWQRARQQQDQQRTARLRGTIDAIRSVQLRDRPEKNAFMRVRLDDGSSRVVDFGPVSKARMTRVNTGDRVLIAGPVRSIDGTPVLKAQRLRILRDNQGRPYRPTAQEVEYEREDERDYADYSPWGEDDWDDNFKQ